MRDELIAPAATITAALIQRMSASQPNNGVSTDEIKSAFLQAMEALEDAEGAIAAGNWRTSPGPRSHWDTDPAP